MTRQFSVFEALARSLGKWAFFLASVAALPLAGAIAQQPAPPPPAQTAPAQPTQPAQSATPPAQTPPDASAQQPIRVTVNEVPLIFTVTDRHGHYIPNLNQSDFAL